MRNKIGKIKIKIRKKHGHYNNLVDVVVSFILFQPSFICYLVVAGVSVGFFSR